MDPILTRFWKSFGWILEGILDLRTEKLILIFLCGMSSDWGDQEKVDGWMGAWMEKY